MLLSTSCWRSTARKGHPNTFTIKHNFMKAHSTHCWKQTNKQTNKKRLIPISAKRDGLLNQLWWRYTRSGAEGGRGGMGGGGGLSQHKLTNSLLRQTSRSPVSSWTDERMITANKRGVNESSTQAGFTRRDLSSRWVRQTSRQVTLRIVITSAYVSVIIHQRSFLFDLVLYILLGIGKDLQKLSWLTIKTVTTSHFVVSTG